jgi:hypothetical protein
MRSAATQHAAAGTSDIGSSDMYRTVGDDAVSTAATTPVDELKNLRPMRYVNTTSSAPQTGAM